MVPSQPLPDSIPLLSLPSTLSAFLQGWSYLFFSQLRVLFNLFFFGLPGLVLRHSTPCPAHDKNAWECSASHIPPLSEHPVLNAPWEEAFSEAFPTALTPLWASGLVVMKVKGTETAGKGGHLGNIMYGPRPVLSSRSLKRDIKRLLLLSGWWCHCLISVVMISIWEICLALCGPFWLELIMWHWQSDEKWECDDAWINAEITPWA